MVTNAAITGLTERLVQDGHVERAGDAADRRAVRIRLTEDGRIYFLAMARQHERWVVELFAGLTDGQKAQLRELTGDLKTPTYAALGAQILFGTARALMCQFGFRHNGRRLDLHQRLVLDESRHLHRGHRRIMAADGFDVGATDLAAGWRGIRACRHVPGHAHDVLGAAPPARSTATMLASAWRVCAAKSSVSQTPSDSSRPGRRRRPAGRWRRRRWHSPWAAASLRAGALRSFIAAGQSFSGRVLQQLAGDDELLHLGRAFVDAQRADLAVQPLDRLRRSPRRGRRRSAPPRR